MNVSGVSGQPQYQATQQVAASVRRAAVQQAATPAAQQRPDGDGDHGVEAQGGATSGSKTGQILNVLA